MLGLSRLAGFQASDRLSGKPTFLGKTASRSGFLSTEVQGRPLPSHPPAAGLIGTRRSGAHRAGGSAQLPKKGQLSTFCSLETNWTAGLGRGAREDAGRALPQPCPQPCPPRGRGARWGGAERGWWWPRRLVRAGVELCVVFVVMSALEKQLHLGRLPTRPPLPGGGGQSGSKMRMG